MIEIPPRRGYVAVVDDGDVELVGPYRWHGVVQAHTVCAIARLPRRHGKQRTLCLHRLIVVA